SSDLGRLELRAPVTRAVDLGVAGDRRQHGRAATAVRQQQDGVGAAAGRVLGSLVRADQQPRRRLVIGALNLGRGVHLGDLGPRDQRDDDQKRQPERQQQPQQAQAAALAWLLRRLRTASRRRQVRRRRGAARGRGHGGGPVGLVVVQPVVAV